MDEHSSPSPLDDPDYAAFAWARYRRLLRWMALAATTCVVIAIGALWVRNGPLPIHMIVATMGGIFVSVMLMSALMGLVFLSSGSGHDEKVEDPLKDHIDVE